MSQDAMLPCFTCGKTLQNAVSDVDNQPYAGTEFRTYGHYGSTFWDSFDGEELVLNICDACLGENSARLGQQKRYRPVVASYVGMVGRHQVDRPMVPYSGNRDDGDLKVDIEQIGTEIAGIEWTGDADNMREIREYALKLAEGQ